MLVRIRTLTECSSWISKYFISSVTIRSSRWFTTLYHSYDWRPYLTWKAWTLSLCQLWVSLAPQSLEMHEPKVREAHNGEEDVLEGAEPRLLVPVHIRQEWVQLHITGGWSTGEIAVCWLLASAALRTAMMHSICFPGLEDQLSMAGKWWKVQHLLQEHRKKSAFFNPSKFLVYFYLYLELIGI